MINNSKIIYSPEYDLLPRGFGVLHPFDVRKYSRAWKEVERFLLPDFKSHWIQPASTIAEAALLRVHTQQYLDSLINSTVVASIVEVALARFLPAIFLDKYLLQPMRYACEGTRLATQYALDGAMVMNMSGGYHHAFADHGEGFCVYADAAVAIADARARGLLHNTDKVIMIDLDAHRGNGFNSIADTESQLYISNTSTRLSVSAIELKPLPRCASRSIIITLSVFCNKSRALASAIATAASAYTQKPSP